MTRKREGQQAKENNNAIRKSPGTAGRGDEASGVPLRVLLVEDSQNDATLFACEIERGGYRPSLRRVETREALEDALEKGEWDVIICDHSMPRLNAPEALDLVKRRGLDTPFIVLSGRIDQETAVAVLKAGARDYVMKDQLPLINPAIKRVLHEAEMRRERERAEKALKESEQRFRSLVRYASDIVVLLDANGTILYESPAVEHVLGYSFEERGGKNAFDLVHPEDVQRVRDAFCRRLNRPGSRASVEYRMKARDGSWRHLEGVGRNLLEEPGVGGLVVNVRDVTGRRQAERALQQSEELYRAVVEQSAENIFLVDTQTKRILQANAALRRTLGYTKQELQNMTLYEIVAHDKPSVDRNIQRVLEDGSVLLGERSYRRKDGSAVEAEVSASVISYGGRRAVCVVSRDLTERKRAEARYRTLVEQLPVVTYIRDAQMNTLSYLSPQFEEMMGYSCEQYKGDPTLRTRTMHPDDRARVLAEDRRAHRTGESYRTEHRKITRDGRLIWVLDEAVLVRDVQGQPLYWQGVLQDITERKRSEQTLRLFAEAGEVLASSLDYRKTLSELARLVVPTLADWCVMDVLEEDGSIVPVAVAHKDPQKAAWARELMHRSTQDTGAPRRVSRVLRGGRAELCPEVTDETLEGWAQDAGHLEMLRKAGLTSTMVVPLVARGRTVGVFTLVAADSGRHYGKVDLQIAEDFARRAALAVETARLYEEARNEIARRKKTEDKMRRILEVLLAVHEAGHILGSTLASEEVATRLLGIMQRVLKLNAAVITMPDERGELRIWHAVGLESLWRGARHQPEAEKARRAAWEKGHRTLFELRRPNSEERVVGLCLPLRALERTVGVLGVYGPDTLAREDAMDLLSSLATQAASALQNARLYEQLSEREQRLEDLVRKLLVGQEEERRRVAYEVHDGLAQTIAATHQHLEGFASRHSPASSEGREELQEVVRLVSRAVEEARQVIADLRPTTLDYFGLGTAVRAMVDDMRAGGIRVDYKEELGGERMPAPVETALYRITQEALANVRKHAQTNRVRVTLSRQEERGVRLEVRDWGRGFAPGELAGQSGPGERVGLSSIRERVTLLGGDLVIESKPGFGTRIEADIPLFAAPAEEVDRA